MPETQSEKRLRDLWTIWGNEVIHDYEGNSKYRYNTKQNIWQVIDQNRANSIYCRNKAKEKFNKGFQSKEDDDQMYNWWERFSEGWGHKDETGRYWYTGKLYGLEEVVAHKSNIFSVYACFLHAGFSTDAPQISQNRRYFTKKLGDPLHHEINRNGCWRVIASQNLFRWIWTH